VATPATSNAARVENRDNWYLVVAEEWHEMRCEEELIAVEQEEGSSRENIGLRDTNGGRCDIGRCVALPRTARRIDASRMAQTARAVNFNSGKESHVARVETGMAYERAIRSREI
jgi:hypothetical protein